MRLSLGSICMHATGTRYVFLKWVEDSSTNNPRASENMNSPKTFTAEYKTQYYLTVRTDPPGLSPAPTPPSQWYNESTNVMLTAQTVSGYTFNYWDVDGTPQGSGVNPITLHMDNPHTAIAHYQTVAPPPPPVGGKATPIIKAIDQPELQIPWVWLTTIILPLVATVVFVKLKRKKR